MKSEKIDVLKIELEGQEATDFKSAIEKIVSENERAGFNQVLKPDEKKIIKELHEKIK